MGATLFVGTAFSLIAAPRPAAAAEPDGESTADDANGQVSEAEAQSGENENSETDLSVETVAPEAESTQDPRMPSGWVTRVDLEDQFREGRGLGDALEAVAGVEVRSTGGLGQPAFASVRGGNPRQMDVLLNGIDISAPAGPGFDLGGLSTQWLDGVDVYRGSAAALHGSGALTGAADLRMHPPEEEGWRAGATTLAGSFNTWGAAAQAASATETRAVELHASWRRSSGDFQFVDEQGQSHRRLNNHHRQIAVAGTARAGLDGHAADEHGVDAAFLYETNQRGSAGPSEYQRSFRRAHTRSERLALIGGWNRRAAAGGDWGALDLEADLGVTRNRLEYENPQPYLTDDPFESDATHLAVEGRFGAHGYFSVDNIAHLGLTVRAERYRARQSGAEDLQVDRQTLGATLSDEWMLLDRRLSLVAGLHAEFVAGRRTYLPLVPSAGVIVRAAPWLKFKGNVARTHRAPDFDELYLKTESIRGNPDLEPERALQVDGGVAVGSEAWPVGGEVTGFHHEIARSILFLPKTAYLFEATNLDGAEATGLESSIHASVDRWFRARATYTFTDAHLTGLPGVQLPHRPRHRGGLRGHLDLAAMEFASDWNSIEGLALQFGARARSRVNLDNFGNLTNRAYWQVDLGASISPVRWLSASLQIQNLTDNRWGADTLQRPLPGRSIFASVQVREGTIGR